MGCGLDKLKMGQLDEITVGCPLTKRSIGKLKDLSDRDLPSSTYYMEYLYPY